VSQRTGSRACPPVGQAVLACSLPAHQKIALWLLRDAHSPAALLASFDTFAPLLHEAGHDRAGLNAHDELIRYMWKVSGPLWEELEAKLRRLGHHFEEAIMTTAVSLLAEGRAEGRAQARIETLRDLLRFKFKLLDAASEARLQTATSAEIDRYFRRLLTADSLAEVFDGRAPRQAPRSHSRGARRARGQRARSSR
jgi:hypothetical protein